MTEDEAKQRWCPFASVLWAKRNGEGESWSTTASPARNRVAIEHGGDEFVAPGSFCIGSACMAWRKSTHFIDRATGEPAIPGRAALGDLELRYSDHGYCGLAGAPQ